MNETLKLKADKFLEYSNTIKKDNKLEYGITSQFSALMHILKNKSYNNDSISTIKKSIKNRTGMFSSFRGSNLVLLSSLMAVEFGESEMKVEELLSYEKKLRDAGFKKSSYMPMTAFSVLMTADSSSADKRIEKAYSIYTEMKNNHPWLTGGDDHPLCVLLSSSDENVDVLSQRIEQNYTALNNAGFSKGNSLQFLSHILTFSTDDSESIARKCRSIYDTLKENKLKVSQSYYAALGLITLISENDPTIIDSLIQLAKYLKDSKELKWSDKGTSILFASALLGADYIDSKDTLVSTALTISIETLIAAQIAATTAAIVAAGAAAGAAASN